MRIPAARAVAGITLALMLAAAASYAAVGRGGGHERRGTGAPVAQRSAPVVAAGTAAIRIVAHPPEVTISPTARFRVAATGSPRLRCGLDRGARKACARRIVYRRVGPGRHIFHVRALRPGAVPLRARFVWTVLEPRPFTISPRPAAIGPLYPGAAPSPIPVVLTNPNPATITVTSLRVSAAGGAAGCDPGANLALTVPPLGDGILRVPAHDSVSLPSASVPAPTIVLRDLPVDQDACEDASFDLSFSGSAGS
jgi:hypothetical protein